MSTVSTDVGVALAYYALYVLAPLHPCMHASMQPVVSHVLNLYVSHVCQLTHMHLNQVTEYQTPCQTPLATSIREPAATSIPASPHRAGAEMPRGAGAETGTLSAQHTPNRFGYSSAGGYSTPFGRRSEQPRPGRRASDGASKIPQYRSRSSSHDASLTPTACHSLSTTPRTRAGSAGPAQRKPRPPALSVIAKRNRVVSPPETLGPIARPEKLSTFVSSRCDTGALQTSIQLAPGAQASNQQNTSRDEHRDVEAEASVEPEASGSSQAEASVEAQASVEPQASAEKQQPQGTAAGFEESWLPSPVCAPLQVRLALTPSQQTLLTLPSQHTLVRHAPLKFAPEIPTCASIPKLAIIKYCRMACGAGMRYESVHAGQV